MYVSQSEGAKFWMQVLSDLKNRGVEDILIACVDGLSGFPDAIESVFPKTNVQLCVVHQIRNSLKYINAKSQKEFLKELKLVYAASTKTEAEIALKKLEVYGKPPRGGMENLLARTQRLKHDHHG